MEKDKSKEEKNKEVNTGKWAFDYEKLKHDARGDIKNPEEKDPAKSVDIEKNNKAAE